jgi:hypothetical protein
MRIREIGLVSGPSTGEAKKMKTLMSVNESAGSWASLMGWPRLLG